MDTDERTKVEEANKMKLGHSDERTKVDKANRMDLEPGGAMAADPDITHERPTEADTTEANCSAPAQNMTGRSGSNLT